MKNLGKKQESMYPTAVESGKNKVLYPAITLPLDLISDAGVDFNDEITLTIKGKITRVEKSKWAKDFSIEAREGEVISDKPKKQKTLVG